MEVRLMCWSDDQWGCDSGKKFGSYFHFALTLIGLVK
jgi:hypothetical protein